MAEQMKDPQGAFLEIYDAHIKRQGSAELRAYLLRSDFFRAPASTRYHCAYEGGLCEHSVNVYRRLLRNVQQEYGEEWENVVSHETVAICGLLHDLCKIDFYKTDYRNVKENGEWVKKPYYARDELLPFGHGEKSVYIANSFLRLTREEAMAVAAAATIRSGRRLRNFLLRSCCTFRILRQVTSTKNDPNIKK